MPGLGLGKKVVIVDDVNFLLLSASERLKEKYEVYTATSAKGLFTVLCNIYPDIILLDINMPDTDGFETIKRLKEDKRFSKIPVIFLSGNCDGEFLRRAKISGAVDFIEKPFTNETLTESIEIQLNPKKKEEIKPLILAVDDNPSILKSVNQILRDKYVVRTLPKPEHLKALLATILPDLFLLDLKMPELSGLDLVEIIRENRIHKETPIIFLTSDSTVDSLESSLACGVADFIKKPVDENILQDKVAAQLKDFIMKRRIRERL